MDYEKLLMCCSKCEKTSMKLVVDGYCFMDLDNNGICINCYNLLNKMELAKKFRAEWLDKPMPIDFDIYE